MIIRNEKVSDIEVIAEVTIAAFQNLPISNHTEQFIINALRAGNALTIDRRQLHLPLTTITLTVSQG
jgi:putative acetyltransferase